MFNSIRTKLTLWYVGILALVIIAFAASMYFIFVSALNRDLDARLEGMARNFLVALEAERADEEEKRDPEQLIEETVDEFRFRDYQFIVYSNDGRLIASTAEFEVDPNALPARASFDNFSSNSNKGPESFRFFNTSFAAGQERYRLLIFHSLKEQKTIENRLTGTFLLAAPLALLLAGFGGYFLARKSLAPMVEMGRQAAQIGASNLDERISIKNKRDELGDLAAVFNELLARLDSSFEQQRRFMADASHELRTPLSIVRGESEVALSKDDRSTKDYRESLAIVHDESKRLTRIVEDLFTLARADAGQFQTNFALVYLDEIIGEVARSVRVLADNKEIDVSFSAETEMPFEGDEILLRRLFLNLLDNAIKYNHDEGKISITCGSANGHYRITISDTGIGIPLAEQKDIFARFYRVDKARSRTEETAMSGAGLGLSIAQWIAEIHKGGIELAHSDATGSSFLVIFPTLNGK
jgi:heavy metal sensor kinase